MSSVHTVGGSTLLCQFIEPVTLRVYICILEYRIGQIFRYTYKHLEHLRYDVWPDVRPETHIYNNP